MDTRPYDDTTDNFRITRVHFENADLADYHLYNIDSRIFTSLRLQLTVPRSLYAQDISQSSPISDVNKKSLNVSINYLLSLLYNARASNPSIEFPLVFKGKLGRTALQNYVVFGYHITIDIPDDASDAYRDIMTIVMVHHRTWLIQTRFDFIPAEYNYTPNVSDFLQDTTTTSDTLTVPAVELTMERLQEARDSFTQALQEAVTEPLVPAPRAVRAGDTVSIVAGTYGMGDSVVGDTAIVVRVDVAQKIYCVQTTKNSTLLYFAFEDVVLVEPDNTKKERRSPDETSELDRRVAAVTRTISKLSETVKESVTRRRMEIQEKLLDLEKQHRAVTNSLNEISVVERSVKTRQTTLIKTIQDRNMLRVLLDRCYKDIVISVDSDTSKFILLAITKPIELRFDESVTDRKIFSMGSYEIRIIVDGKASTVSIRKPAGSETRDGYCHPHVGRDFKPCYGTYNKTVSEHLGQHDYVSLLYTLHDFLSSCYSEGWYLSIYHWLPDDERSEFCFDCQHTEDDCQCDEVDTCETCEEHINDCECARCPENGELLVSEFFPDAGCLNCSHCVHNKRADSFMCKYNQTIQDDDEYVHAADVSDVIRFITHNNIPDRNIRHSMIDENGTYIPRQ